MNLISVLMLFATLFSHTLVLAQTNADEVSFDVNDVSFLMPLVDASSPQKGLLALSRADGSAPYISIRNFSILVPGSSGTGHLAFAQWWILGVRVDPCTKENPQQDPCQAQFRLVVQPLKPNGETLQVIDAAVHLVYGVPSTEVSKLIADLISLKKIAGNKTDGVRLGIHPVLASEGMNSRYGARLREIIEYYAKEQRLIAATRWSLDLSAIITMDRQWSFARTVMKDGTLVRTPIPNATGNTQKLLLQMKDSGKQHFVPSRVLVQDPGTSTDRVNEMNDSYSEGAWNALAEHQKTSAIDSALRVENPLVTGARSVDCVSCHTASRALSRTQGASFPVVQDGNPNRYPIPEGITGGNTLIDDSPRNLVAFGFAPFSGKFLPVVTQGTVNSSAHVAHTMNRLIPRMHIN